MNTAESSQVTIEQSANARSSSSPDRVCRGILITLIVLGHNEIFRLAHYQIYSGLYTFHVAAFLILPFLKVGGRSQDRRIGEIISFYYRPFFVFVTLYFLAFCAYSLQDPEMQDTTGGWFLHYMGAVTIANSAQVNAATGFEMFWFLPVFTLLMIVRQYWDKCAESQRTLIVAAAAAAHFFAAPVLRPYVEWLPWGVPILLYVLLPCLVASSFAGSTIGQPRNVLVSGIVFSAALALSASRDFAINLSDYKVYDSSNLSGLLLTDVVMISGVLFIYGLSHHIHSKGLGLIGAHSLQIYLTHGVIGFVLVKLVSKLWLAPNTELLLSFVATLAISLLASTVLLLTSAGRWIFSAHRPRVSAIGSAAPAATA